MELTQRERHELDEAAGRHAVYVIRRVERAEIVPVQELSTVPITQLQQDYLWRWNDIDGIWEHYGDQGSTVPTDIYMPTMPPLARREWVYRNERRTARAVRAERRNRILPPHDDGQPATGLAQLVDNGTVETTYSNIQAGTFAWGPMINAVDQGDTGAWRIVNMEPPRRGNNYDIVHKANE